MNGPHSWGSINLKLSLSHHPEILMRFDRAFSLCIALMVSLPLLGVSDAKAVAENLTNGF